MGGPQHVGFWITHVDSRPVASKFLVSNALLKSVLPGLSYHTAQDSAASLDDERVPWASTVEGTVTDDWLQVGQYFLPLHVDEKPVLFPVVSEQVERHSVTETLDVTKVPGRTFEVQLRWFRMWANSK